MPAALEKCVQGVIDSGKDKSEAYAICGKRTGWVKSKNGWKNKKTGETFNETFKSFKTFLTEYTERDISELIANKSIPLDPGLMKRLGYYQEDVEAYHVTNTRDLWSMADKQNKIKNHISCFTKGGPELARLPSQPEVLLKLQGDSIIEGKTDIWSLVSVRGKRWLDIKDRPGAKKLEKYVEGVIEKTFKSIGIILPSKYDYQLVLDELSVMSKSESKEFYKIYLREMESMLNKSYKELNLYLRTAADMSYNEVILTKWKILEVQCLENEIGAVKKWCEDKGISYGGAFPRRDLSNLKV
jgi:hypothetical protein